jgi:hypothetical protein
MKAEVKITTAYESTSTIFSVYSGNSHSLGWAVPKHLVMKFKSYAKHHGIKFLSFGESSYYVGYWFITTQNGCDANLWNLNYEEN